MFTVATTNILSLNWSKNWEGRFSLLFASMGIQMSHFKEIFGEGPTHALVFYREGVCSCYFVDEEMETFGKHLVQIIRKYPSKLDEWISITRSDIDTLRNMMKMKITGSDFHTIKALLHRFGIYSFALKELSNFLPQNMSMEVLPKITAIRKYGETVYFDISEYITNVIKDIERQTNITADILECMTADECEQYFKQAHKINTSELSSRNKGSSIFFNPLPQFLNERDIDQVRTYLLKDSNAKFVTGQTAFAGTHVGVCKIISKFSPDLELPEGSILITGMTDPRFVPLMKKAGAIVTDAGGMLCHAAIVSRELKIPCIVGTKFATEVFRDGDMVEVDANTGIVRKL